MATTMEDDAVNAGKKRLNETNWRRGSTFNILVVIVKCNINELAVI